MKARDFKEQLICARGNHFSFSFLPEYLNRIAGIAAEFGDNQMFSDSCSGRLPLRVG
jgi:hypothetical protein